MDKILFSPIDLQELISNVRTVIKEEIQASQEQQLQEKLLTTEEVGELLRVSRQTVINWSREGILIKYTMGHKVYWKYSEIITALKTVKKFKRLTATNS
jgi:hypothetical protein